MAWWGGKGQVGGDEMENITALSMTACYALALLLFGLASARRFLDARRVIGSPPAIPAGKVPVWMYRPIDLLGVLLVVGVFYLLSMGNAMAEKAEGGAELTIEALIFSIGFQFLMMFMVIAAVARRVGIVEWLGLVWEKWPLVFAIAPAAVLSMWALFAGLYEFGYMDLMERLGVEKVQEAVQIFQTEVNPVVLGLMAFAASIVAPLCEEVVFRGYLYPVAKKFAGPSIAAIATALVFSAAHGSLAALLPLFIFGLVLVAMYEWTGSIWAPIGVHALFNGATVAIQLLMRYADLPQNLVQ